MNRRSFLGRILAAAVATPALDRIVASTVVRPPTAEVTAMAMTQIVDLLKELRPAPGAKNLTFRMAVAEIKSGKRHVSEDEANRRNLYT